MSSNALLALLPGLPRNRTRSLLPAWMVTAVRASSTTEEKPPTSTYSCTDELPSRSNPVSTKFCSATAVVVPDTTNWNVKSA